jgi:methylated-DNA-protein-cysteine methyltransferase-like protein
MTFKEAVILFVNKIPKGKVVSYRQVAAACGHPRAPRQVGGILKSLDISSVSIPWWRVINNQGIISIKGNWAATKELQKDLLLKDGIEVKDFKIDPSTFWRANNQLLESMKIDSTAVGVNKSKKVRGKYKKI